MYWLKMRHLLRLEQVISPLVGRSMKIYALYFDFYFGIVHSDYLELLWALF